MKDIHCLIVDDEEEFLNVMIKRLRKRELSISGVQSGEEALTYLENEPVDIVLLDVKMPGMDGIQTLRTIKDHYPGVEVILLTGHASLEAAVEGLDLGAFDYMMKPVSIDDIIYKIEDAYRKITLEGPN